MVSSLWIISLAAVALVSGISFAGAAVLAAGRARLDRNSHFLAAFAVGGLFGDAYIHLLPEAFRSGEGTLGKSLAVLAGFFCFHSIDGFLSAHGNGHGDQRRHRRSLIAMNLIGDGVHNFMDGLLIGASFGAGIPIGLSTTLAVLLHEIPQEIGDFGILLHAGFTPRKALAWNFASSLTAVAGAILSLLMGPRLEGYTGIMLPFTAGGFVYMGGSVLLPSLAPERGARIVPMDWMAMAAGVGVMAALAALD